MYLLEEHLVYPAIDEPFASLRFLLASGSTVSLKRWDEWPWKVDESDYCVLMVLRQDAEDTFSPRMPAVLKGHPNWNSAKHLFQAALRPLAFADAFHRRRSEHPEGIEIHEALLREFDLPTINVGLEEVNLDDHAELDDDHAELGKMTGEYPKQAIHRIVWPLVQPLPWPTGLSLDKLKRHARTALQNENLSDTDQAVHLLLSEMLPSSLGGPSAPHSAPDSVVVTSFLLGDALQPPNVFRYVGDGTELQTEENIDPVAAEAFFRFYGIPCPWEGTQFPDSSEHGLPQHGSEALFSITRSSSWATTRTIKKAAQTATAHKTWWMYRATCVPDNTDRRKIPDRRRFDEVHQDEKTDEQRDIEAHLSGQITKEEVHARAYQRREAIDGQKLTPNQRINYAAAICGVFNIGAGLSYPALA